MIEVDFIQKIVEAAESALAETNKATESDWSSILAGGLEDILKLCREQLTEYERGNDMGGKPKTSTPKDMRLKANNPNVGKPAAKPAPKPMVKKG